MSYALGVLRSSVQEQRKQAGLGAAELARRAGITRQALHNIETGHSAPTTVVALRLAQALGCRVDELFSLSPGTVQARLTGDAAPGDACGWPGWPTSCWPCRCTARRA
ncbi:helix-turn-helix transcriptional regulator [Deinococcus radiopugnans]|uniref:helix-turn-helix transcriptional regulator n=1 Tax=Deinococcus radiopugnans TaxID=57497 RepID=UPI0036241548